MRRDLKSREGLGEAEDGLKLFRGSYGNEQIPKLVKNTAESIHDLYVADYERNYVDIKSTSLRQKKLRDPTALLFPLLCTAHGLLD